MTVSGGFLKDLFMSADLWICFPSFSNQEPTGEFCFFNCQVFAVLVVSDVTVG